jgi:hypothetical protein
MGIIDRILSGEFDEEKDSVKSVPPTQAQNGKSRITDPDEDEDELEDEDETPRDDFENLPTEEVDDSAEEFIISDIPDDEYMREYSLEHDIEVFDGPELVGAAPTQYVEKPKQSKVRETGKKKTMSNPTNNTAETNPKQSITKAETTGAKKRGAPHKLGDNTAEVCRLYSEGVGAKDIADKFGVSVSCVINTLKRNNIAIRPKGRRKTSE